MTKKDVLYLSVVVTFYNEKEGVCLFHEELMKSLNSIHQSFEVIYIDDGSSDGTNELLKELVNKEPASITLVEFRKNFGQTAGLQAGFDHAEGEIIIAMDGDLQHDPAEIPKFIKKIEEGYDLVSGWREKRVDNFWLRRLPSLMANRFMAALSGIELHDFGTTFKAYRREIIKDINLYGGLHRFIPVLAAQMGARICELPIKNIVRPHGKSKYGLSRISTVFFDILTVAFFLSYSTRPMQFLGKVGLASFFSGGALLLYIITAYLMWGTDLRGTMQVAIMFIILGIHLFIIGLVLEFLSRIHHESTGKKIYATRKIYKRS